MRELIVKVDDPGERVWDGSPKVFETRDLVRCHECKYRGNPRKCILAFVADLKHLPFFVYDNHGEWFCADGKPKE